MLTQPQIEDRIINLIAKQKRCDATQLRTDLTAAGSAMPVDSHRLVRAYFKLQRELGVPRIKWNNTLKPHFKSVRGLAALLHSHQQSHQRAA